jgi:polar amino acid transport system substrate-binding protein
VKKPHAYAALAAAIVLAASGCAQQAAPSTKAAAGCKPEWTFSTIQPGKLVVAAVLSQSNVLDIPPGGDKATGVDADIYNGFAKRACLPIEWRPLGGPAAVAALTQKQADLGGGGWIATPARGKVIGQTDATWYSYGGILSKQGMSSIDQLKSSGATVGLIGGSIYAEPMQAALGSSHVKQYENTEGILQDLKAGRIQAGIGQISELEFLRDHRGADDFKAEAMAPDPQYPDITNPGSINIPHTLSNTALGNALNDYIHQIRADGTLKQILAKNALGDPRYFEPPTS